MNSNVLRAVFTRNFISYFTNPTGYVFICLFVLLSSWRAFWPDEFFISNLANLDQLNNVFPWIMLVFIPAITMSVWAEERREGTDELLLTVPSTDLDIVVGKYLAALAIYTVSLLFSFAASLIVLRTLGNPDVGLFTSTYMGYWLVGLAMLSIGMVASFLTSNLTVAYVFGALFNLPLIFAYYINKTRFNLFDWLDLFGFDSAGSVLPNLTFSLTTRPWSLQQQLSDFARGVPTFSGVVYFVAIAVVMLYLSMILMGRRHWSNSSNAFTTGMHYFIRVVSLGVIMLGLFTASQQVGLHYDMTSEQLTSLSPHTVDLLDKLDTKKRPVRIDAFISPDVPESYVQTRLNLLNTLKEMQAVGGTKIDLVIHETKRFGEEATLADERFRITARKVTTEERGAFADDFIYMGVAFRCGLSPVTIPFFDRGTPIEYELIRSICTVAQQKRKTVGVLTTDAQLYGQFNMQSMQPGRNWPIIDELEKQYEVVRIDPKQPIDAKKIDVLLAVQPSSLGPPEMDNFIAAIKAGLPTAIFEDPAPMLTGGVPATSAPRQSNNRMAAMMGRQQQSPPKGDIKKLWSLLGVNFSPDTVIWQKYNPYPKFDQFPDEFVFVDKGAGVDEPFNVEEPVSSGLQQVLFPFPGSISKIGSEKVLKITPLAVTADKATGTIPLQMIRQGIRRPTNETYVLAARIRGEIETTAAQETPAEGEEPKEAKTVKSTINVVLAADVDMLSPAFFEIRAKGNMPEMGINFEFDNVTFVLNVLDELAGNSDFLEIRKRRRVHRTLTQIQERTEAAREASTKAVEDEREEFKQARTDVEKGLTDAIQKLQKEMNDKHVDIQEIVRRVGIVQRDGQKRMDAKIEQMEQKRDKKILRVDTQLSNEIEEVQNSYRMWAVLLPPIPPLILACFVFFIRRAREREGVSQTRLR